MGDAMVVAVAHEDGFAEELEMTARALSEEAIDGLIPLRDEVVADMALRAKDRLVEPAMEGARGSLPMGSVPERIAAMVRSMEALEGNGTAARMRLSGISPLSRNLSPKV